MSTHATLAYRIEDTFLTSYVHYDGNLEGVGEALRINFNDRDLARELVELGNLRSLTVEGDAEAYHRDIGESWLHNKPRRQPARRPRDMDALLCNAEQYVYLFENGEWHYVDRHRGSTFPLSALKVRGQYVHLSFQ